MAGFIYCRSGLGWIFSAGFRIGRIFILVFARVRYFEIFDFFTGKK